MFRALVNDAVPILRAVLYLLLVCEHLSKIEKNNCVVMSVTCQMSVITRIC